MHLEDTTTGEIMKALAELIHAVGGSSSLALNLVALTTEDEREEVEEAASQAAQEHPYRLILAIPRDTDAEKPRIDAEVTLGERLGAAEAVILRLDGPATAHLTSIVLPMLAPDVPVVTWWLLDPVRYGLEQELRTFADRRITYSARATDPVESLYRRAQTYVAGDTDICWTRISLWRSLIASCFDGVTHAVEKVDIKADRRDPSAQLMAAWLHTRLGVTPEVVDTKVERNSEHLPAIASVGFTMENGETMEVERNADGETVLRQAGLPKRRQTLQGRTLGQLLAEELRHIDPDTAYRRVLDTFKENHSLTVEDS
ncbi:glucose-6-phosphate dehydrogenase assembly protein OpcA [Glycomyces sp. L485]|uniref:glucose-6-phosphate dehydrogenase assembly protein OpcA n=1 Tax=Glycomyces sp. L485 TaxID=2909235 RepID=UPI001F4A3B1E|nr:glucose-6-phosphate dehydrogenase assembly protein OpcA [Glycomyces sp. L485]MCH7230123.1 glucose-6-phosphate dehydrogenase assembly protein OpcA [Glycomyces sp. L485]